MRPVARRSKRRGRLSRASRLQVELLESRCLLTGSPGASAVLQPVPNQTQDQAAFADLGDLTFTPAARAWGSIGTGTAGAADVAWYQFSLDGPADIRLTADGVAGVTPLTSTISLYNSDPFDLADVYDPAWTRLLAQSEQGALTGPATIERQLAAGTYYVAVSGAGNRYFYPFLAGSGTAGRTGDYTLQVTATDLGLDPLGTPQLLCADVSPQTVRLDLSAPLNPDPVVALTDDAGKAVGLLWSNFSTNVNELQLAPARALATGTYHVAVTDGEGNQTFAATFQVAGSAAYPDDTAATAHDLGDVTRSRLLQVGGAVGDDPYYDALSPDPALNPGNQVNLYHFRISGPGRYAVVAEVFAGRIGSPLFAGVSLYRLDPADHRLHFVRGNDETSNPARGTDFTTPLFTDPALSAGLTAGDYYVAVSSSANTPSPEQGQVAGPDSGIFNPNIPRSGSAGTSTGPYVLNLLAYPAPASPTVLSASVAEGETLDASPVTLAVRFSAPVNLSQLAFDAFQRTSQDTVSAVYVQGTDPATGRPVKYFPRLDSYDHAANEATFVMLDGLADGSYALHLSGPAGLTDAADNALAGNDPGGDYVIHFRVQGSPRGPAGSPLQWEDQEPNGDFTRPQGLGVLFPHDLQAGVDLDATLRPDSPGTPIAPNHYYAFQVLQDQAYFIGLSGSNLPPDAVIALYDTSEGLLAVPPPGLPADDQAMTVELAPGTYVIGVSWTSDPPDVTRPVEFQIHLALQGDADNAPPLLSGPAPAVQIRLDGATPAAGATPSVTLAAPGSAASAPSGNGIIPAAFQIVDLAPARFVVAASIPTPTGALLSLADGPVGGPGNGRGGNDALSLDQVAIRLPDAPAAVSFVDVTVGTLLVGGGSLAPVRAGIIDLFFGSLSDAGGEVLNRLVRALRPLLEGLFQGNDWWEGLRQPPGQGGAAPAMPAPREGSAPGDVLPDPESQEAPAFGEETLAPSEGARAASLILAAAVAGMWLTPCGPGRRSAERRGRPTMSRNLAADDYWGQCG